MRIPNLVTGVTARLQGDYAEAYIRAVEALQPEGAEKARKP